ncbi:uncharacterized protein LOC120355172 [Nilaparvata lugens]|uniref:uncharacterized protein LOC120355172 n=1 Tax=Nilaparvata lugens TaxID=108931 RepID=UPI00193DE0B8|nr:uncharacterized protein LOC120355172 [Nilaparvata lugens]
MSTEEKVIEAVRKYPELFDTNNPNYMKSKLKTRIWMDIAKDLNLKDGEETKNIWLKLRGGYRDARRRHKKSYVSGAPLQKMRTWKYQNQMSFLEPFMSCGQREGNLVDESDDETQLPFQPAGNSHLETNNVTFNSGGSQSSFKLHLDETHASIDEENNEIEQPAIDEGGHEGDNTDLLSRIPNPQQQIPLPPKKRSKWMFEIYWANLLNNEKRGPDNGRKTGENCWKNLQI